MPLSHPWCIEELEAKALLASFTVTNTADSGAGSFRQALLNANAAAGSSIVFDITTGNLTKGVATIQPLSPLPTLSVAVMIDATTQPAYTSSPLVVLDGSLAGASVTGLTLDGSSSIVRGLAIDHFNGTGLAIDGNASLVQGNYIGTDATGTRAAPNGAASAWDPGLLIDAGSNNTIGGTTPAARNVISGNAYDGIDVEYGASGNLIEGNYVGTDATGANALPNTNDGIWFGETSASNTIGGTAAGARNVISGNAAGGIELDSTAGGSQVDSNVVMGNYLGTDASGTRALGNQYGVDIEDAQNNTIGGNTSGAGNVISGNQLGGIRIYGTGADGTGVIGNWIGTDATGSPLIGNAGPGILVTSTGDTNAGYPTSVMIGGTAAGAGNTIADNSGGGVVIQGGDHISVLENSFFGNTNEGIDLGQGPSGYTSGTLTPSAPNEGMNVPVFTSQTWNGTSLTVNGYVGKPRTPGAGFNADRIEVYTADTTGTGNPGEGKTLLGVLTATSQGGFSGTLTPSGAPAFSAITATATDPNGSTSQFSTVVGVTTSGGLLATTTTVQTTASPSTYGQGVTFTASVASVLGLLTTATGTVTFYDSGVPLGTANVSGGMARLATSYLAAGSHSITAVYGGDSLDQPSTSASFTQSVNPAPLTITANNASTVYGQGLPGSFSAAFTGLVAGDTAQSVQSIYPLAFSAGAQSNSNAGTYPISVANFSDPNYTTTYASGTLTITPAPLTVRVGNASMQYGQPLPSFNVYFSGLVNGDTPYNIGGISLSSVATASSPVGTYPVNASINDPNYAVTYIAGSLHITPAPLTVQTVGISKTYGQANPTFTASYTGLANGDTPAVLGTPTFTTTATASSGTGTYPVIPGGLSDPNYTISYAPGYLTINPAHLTVTAANATKVYGAPNPVFSINVLGLVNGDTPAALGTPSFATSATQSSAVGSYTITPGGLSDPNYTVTYGPGTLTVAPAPLTVTADPATRLYGQPEPPFTASYSGLVNGDTAGSLGTLLFSTNDSPASPVGTYDVTPHGLTAPNYTVTYVASSVTVSPAPLTVAADDTTRVYGDPNPPFSASFSGLVNGDTASALGAVTFATAASATSPVGRYPIAPSGVNDANYTITYVAGTLTVSPAPLTVTALNASRAFGQNNPAFAATYGGLVNGDTPSALGPLQFSTAASPTSPIGGYPVVPSGLAATNYSVSYQPGVLTVVPAPLTVRAVDATRVYGQPNPAFGAVFNGLAPGGSAADLGALSFATTAAASSVPGAYPIVVSGLSATNYTVAYQAGTLTVTPRSVWLTVAPVTATRGTTFDGVVATFTDGAPAPPDRYSATIDWGDGHTSSGTVAFDSARGVFTISGQNQYDNAGAYPLAVDVRFLALDAVGAGTATVTDAALAVAPVNFSATAGKPYQGLIATFRATGTPGAPSDYSATVYWGDGQTAQGTVSPAGAGVFGVSAANTYQSDGVYAVRVAVRDASGDMGAATGIAVVAAQPLVLDPTPIMTAVGDTFVGPVAHFAADEAPLPIAAEIDWGDGSTTPAIVMQSAPGLFAVVGTHVYAVAGSVPAMVTVRAADGVPTTIAVPAVVLGATHTNAAEAVPHTDRGQAATSLSTINPPSSVAAPGLPASAPPPVVAAVVPGGDITSQAGGGGPSSRPTGHSDGSSSAAPGHPGGGAPADSTAAAAVAAVQNAATGAVELASHQIAAAAGAAAAGADVQVHLALPKAAQPVFAALTPPSEQFWQALDRLEEQLDAAPPVEAMAEVAGVGAVAYVGYVLLHTRGGYLLISLLSSRPLWADVDPLGLLAEWEMAKTRPGGAPPDDEDDEDESLQSLVEEARTHAGEDDDHVAHEPGPFQPNYQRVVRRPRAGAVARPRGGRAQGAEGPL